MSTTTEEERPSGTIVARRSGYGNSKVVHYPDPESDEPEPLCGTAGPQSVHRTGHTRGSWDTFDHSVFPSRRVCSKCQAQRDDEGGGTQ